MATLGSFLFVVLFIGCWCSLETAADTCIPTVRSEPFVQFMKNKGCDVDEKLLRLFNPESFNNSIANNTVGNFMCIGFMNALTMAPEDLCLFDPLSVISDSDFCSDTKMMTALGRIVNGSVFDTTSIIFIVSNNTIHYCNGICGGYNELCWAFGTIAKVLLKQSSISTTSPTTATTTTTTTTEPTTDPTTDPTTVATKPVVLPSLSNGKGIGTTDHDYDDDDDGGGVTVKPPDYTSEPSSSELFKAYESNTDSELNTSRVNDTHGDIVDSDHKNLDENLDENLDDKPTDDNQEVQGTDTSQNISSNNTKATGVNVTIISENSTANATSEKVTTTSPTGVPTNGTTTVVVPDDNRYDDFDFSNDDQNDGVDSGQNGGVDHDHNDGVDQIDDDDVDQIDDDDGYSYWHFAAILLFILFLGVAGYLASHNRKKVYNLFFLRL